MNVGEGYLVSHEGTVTQHEMLDRVERLAYQAGAGNAGGELKAVKEQLAEANKATEVALEKATSLKTSYNKIFIFGLIFIFF